MTPQWSSLWASVAPAVANHLWQSTLVAAIAGLLMLPLRKNQARVRYWLWLAASIKFLLPFSLLIAVGSHLTTPRPPTGMQTGYYYAAQVTQPFDQLSMPAIVPAVSATQYLSLAHLLPVIVLLAWLSGLIAVLGLWFARWRRIRALVRQAMPVEAGREAAALRRLERASKMSRPVPLRLSAESLEPGIFGVFRPVVLWPEGISAHLNDAHLEAILAHELRHVRYRDNLTAAMHMVVEAIFWFYPVVWWMGAQMVRERERGCDEEVVELGSQPGVYAEGILKACEFCVASPLASFSGVTGADLKKRIVRIMAGRLGGELSRGKRLMLTAIGIAAFAGPFVFGLVNIPHVRAQLLVAPSGPLPSFEVASIKPTKPGATHGDLKIRTSAGRIWFLNEPLTSAFKFAYNVKSDEQLLQEPDWIRTEHWDIEAKVPESQVEAMKDWPLPQRMEQYKLMTQSLLADRFHLRVSVRTKMLRAYVLVVAKQGPILTPAKNNRHSSVSADIGGAKGRVTATGASMDDLANALSSTSDTGDRVVIDSTGLSGSYDFTLTWTPYDSLNAADGGGRPANALPPDVSGPSLFTALQEQLGLKLVSRKAPVEVLVIDHVEKPSEN